MAVQAAQSVRGGPGALNQSDPLGTGPAKSTSAMGIAVKRYEPKELNRPDGLFGKIWDYQEQGMDGVGGGMLKMAPKDLKKAMESDRRDEFLYAAMDFDHFGPWNDSNMEVQSVNRQDVYKALHKMYINLDHDPGAIDLEDRKKLEGHLHTVADALMAQPATDIFKLVDHDTGYGNANALAMVNKNTGEIRYVVNSWAP